MIRMFFLPIQTRAFVLRVVTNTNALSKRLFCFSLIDFVFHSVDVKTPIIVDRSYFFAHDDDAFRREALPSERVRCHR